MFISQREHHRAMQELRQEVANDQRAVLITLQDLQRENTELHKRLNLAKLRTAHIEHYLGMRSMPKGEEVMWDLAQVQTDVKCSRTPLNYHKRNKRAAA